MSFAGSRGKSRPPGTNHEKLTFRYSGRDFRLTDVHGSVVKGIIA